MEYTTRMGSGPNRAHVNYQCPCGCTGGVIYSSDKPLGKAGACCCGRKLWVGESAEEQLRPYLTEGLDYDWDVGSVTLPWGEVAPAAMAWPKEASTAEAGTEPAMLVRDVVCGMMIDPASAAASSAYRDQTFYFCAPGCKESFDANPARYVRSPGLMERLLKRK